MSREFKEFAVRCIVTSPFFLFQFGKWEATWFSPTHALQPAPLDPSLPRTAWAEPTGLPGAPLLSTHSQVSALFSNTHHSCSGWTYICISFRSDSELLSFLDSSKRVHPTARFVHPFPTHPSPLFSSHPLGKSHRKTAYISKIKGAPLPPVLSCRTMHSHTCGAASSPI